MTQSNTFVLVSFLTETTEPVIDLSDVLLDLELTEDLLELFGVLVEASDTCGSVLQCSDYTKCEKG